MDTPSDLPFCWQPQRDSNPCLYLERVRAAGSLTSSYPENPGLVRLLGLVCAIGCRGVPERLRHVNLDYSLRGSLKSFGP